MRITLMAGLLLVLALGASAQPVTIGGVTYDKVDPGDPFTQGFEIKQDWTPPAPTAAETAAGMMLYVAPEPGDYVSYRLPKPAEHAAGLKTFLTPGEDEPVTFGVFSLAGLAALNVTVEGGQAPVTVDVRQIHCWPQRTQWRSRQWYLTGELILPCANGRKTVPYQRGVLQEVAFDVPGQQTQGFWLTLTAPADARPGKYQATVTLAAEGKQPLRVPLEIEVMPFKLQQPENRSWLLYADAARWNGMSEAQVLAEMRDYARHGQNGLIEIGLGSPDLTQLKAGKVTYDASAYRRWASLGAQAGLPGPHVIGSAGAGAVRDVVAPGTNLEQGEWPQPVKDGVKAVAQAAVEATKDLPKWYYYGVDEPTGDNTYAIQDYQAWHDGGAETYATFYVPSFLEKASAYLTAPCFVVGLVSNEKMAQEAREACEKTGAEFWWYGTGSYVNPFPQEGFMFHNRYGAGLLFWKTGARSSCAWTFCRPHEDVFNDFDGSAANSAEPKEQVTAYPHLLKPDDWSTYQGAIPTIAWESLREGVDDYKYLYTLTELIKQAAASPLEPARKLAAGTQIELEAVVNTVPWANPMGGVAFEAQRLQQVRRWTADRIVALQAALAGRATAPTAGSQRFTLVTSTTAGERQVAVPMLALKTASQAPQVDGKLDDPAWREAAVAADFRDIRAGAPSKLGTTARFLADEKALYVAFDCPEPEMAAVVAKEQQHDGTVWLEDGVEIFIAGATRRPYVHLIVTTNGVVLDELNQEASGWNPSLEKAVAKRGDGWSVEVAVPWSELAAAGIQREPLMTMNLGRSRYTKNDPQTHTAWSTTYGGFHVPERFGLVLVQEPPVALTGLKLPSEWGAQSVEATLENLTQAPVQAEFAVAGAGQRTVRLGARAKQVVSLPMTLRRPGERKLRVSWGVAGGALQTAEVVATVPEPVVATPASGLVSPGGSLEMPLKLNLAAQEQEKHRLMVRIQCGDRRTERNLEARPGQQLRLPVQTTGMSKVQVALVDERGRTVWESEEQAVMVLPD